MKLQQTQENYEEFEDEPSTSVSARTIQVLQYEDHTEIVASPENVEKEEDDMLNYDDYGNYL